MSSRLEGELQFDLEGEPSRVIRAGEAFWEPGGDVTIRTPITVTTSGAAIRSRCSVPGQPMLILVDEEELQARRHKTAAPEWSLLSGLNR
jgi:hypothetical protein